jgi:hypothetical protein
VKIKSFLAIYRRPLFTFGCIALCFSALCLITGCGVPTFLTDLEGIIPVAASAVTGILALIGGLTGNAELEAAAAAINAIVAKVDAELEEVNNLITTYKSNPSDTALENIEAAINEVNADLAKILEIGGIPTTLAQTIQNVVQAVTTQLEALLSVIPVFKASTAGASLSVLKPITAAAFKAQVHAALKPAA